MNRPLKFRVWDKAKQIMLPVYVLGNFANENEVMQFTGVLDINEKETWEGDIVKWYSGSMSLNGLPDNVIKSANDSLSRWYKTDKTIDYDWEANGWYKKMNTGVIVFYKGSFCIHNDIDTTQHERDSFYNGTTYYGDIKTDKKSEMVVIGNIFQNPELLDEIIKNKK